MSVNKETYQEITQALQGKATLVAVSKTKPAEDIQELYQLGQRDFGENYVQELVDKELLLPKDIRWHFIGHLQSNKVKYIAPFVHLIHGVDSLKLLSEINKQAKKINRIIPVLLQIHIAKEETKFGLDEAELQSIIQEFYLNPANAHPLQPVFANIKLCGLMGMASFSTNQDLLRAEFNSLQILFNKTKNELEAIGLGTAFTILSMGMSSDYTLALSSGSTLVRIGSLLFGARTYP